MKDNLGMGVMIGMLGGNEEDVAALKNAIGKRITAMNLGDDVLHLTFEDESKIRVWDNGQSCCESRYMHTDDNLADYVPSKLLGMELRKAPIITGEYGSEHEVQFLVVKTGKGHVTFSNHNEHNGYYGGFWIKVDKER